MIAIIGAMEIETSGLIKKMSLTKQKKVNGFTFTQGKIAGKKAVVCCCGIGKVASASATTIINHLYNPEVVINLGVAGGAKPLKQGDIVVSTKVVQHDYDATADGLVLGQIHGFSSPFIDCDQEVASRLYDIASSFKFPVVYGVAATGDQFINSNEKSKWLNSTFGANAFDMESGAVAQVCKLMGKKFCSLRAISDNGDDTAVKSFYEFVTEAAERSIAIVSNFIENY